MLHLVCDLMGGASYQATCLICVVGEFTGQEIRPFASTRPFASRSRAKAISSHPAHPDGVRNRTRSNTCVHITDAEELRGRRRNAAAHSSALRDIDGAFGVY
jgi:hypothetical protein